MPDKREVSLSDDVRILFEDPWLLAVSKPAGLLSHSNPGRETEDSLENRMREKFGPSIVLFHRLDRETSGLLLLGKSREIAGAISRDFETKKIRKAYFAVVEGQWRPQWNKVDEPIEARQAVTTFRLLGGDQDRSWIEALPKTGRQHQIRIHCAKMSCPILGDCRYGAQRLAEGGLALHAYRMNLHHPKTGEHLRILDEPDGDWRARYLLHLDSERAWRQLFQSSNKGEGT